MDKKAEAILEERLRPVIDAESLELVEIEVTKGGRQRFVRVFVDRPEGVSLEDCTRLSRLLGPLIDEMELFDGRYVLEVSSPGATRPLRRERDFVRFAGRLARLYLAEPVEERREWIGDLQGMEESFVLLRPLEGEGQVRIPHELIRTARLEYESPSERAARQQRREEPC
jgi:ribosome maturation factor RimP